VLIAVVAIAASAPSAKADIFLAVTNAGSGPAGGHPTAYYNLTQAGVGNTLGDVAVGGAGTYLISTAAGNAGNLGANFGLATITVSFNTALDANARSLTLNAKVFSDGSTGSYELSLFSSTVTGAFTQGQTAAPGASTGLYSDPGSSTSTAFLTTSLSNVAYAGTGAFALSATSTYTGYGTNATGPSGITDVGLNVNSNVVGPVKGSSIALGSRASTYDISSNDVQITLGANSTLVFHSTATLSLPEPSGVIAAFAGLPCVGMLLGYARRLRGRPAPETAA